MTNKAWKPVYLKLVGDRQRSLSYRKFAEKLLAQSKERNEELGNYANPVHRYKSAEVSVFTQSLPGYDIITIETPIRKGKEQLGTSRLYSGLFESRYNPAGVAWYLRYYPAEYEVFNIEENVIRSSLASSIDGASDFIDPPMPPLRWMYNDYSGTPEEIPWFDSKFIIGPVAGRFSGQLRKLVQLQLGLNMAVGFGYAGNNCNGLRIEELDSGVKRMWLYKIGGGVFMQRMYDYTDEKIAASAGWGEDGVPPEITKNGWFCMQSSWDDAREVWDRATWESTDPANRPALGAVTFQLLDADSITDVMGSMGPLVDYGWSFNSDCSAAVLVGIAPNRISGAYAYNYKSALFTIAIDENEASIASAGTVLFVHHPNDQIKLPDSIGRLWSISLWKNEYGYAATQPSSAYVAPQYAYFDLNDDLQLITYEYNAGSVGDINGNYFTSEWSAAFSDCRTSTGVSPTNYSFQNCSYTESGYGTSGAKHGFNTSVFNADTLKVHTGWEGQWSSPAINSSFRRSGIITVPVSTFQATAKLQWTHHCLSQIEGVFTELAYNCAIVSSFDRLAIYHYKQFRRILSDGRRLSAEYQLYEHGAPVYTDRCFCISKCGLSTCSAVPADYHPEKEVGNYALVASSNWPCNEPIHSHIDFTCYYDGEYVGCWTDATLVTCPGGANLASCPGASDPYEYDQSTYSGAILFPDASLHVFSEDDILNQSRPFRESSEDFGWQDVVSAFDDFSGRWVFSQPEAWISGVITNTEDGEYPTDFIKSWVGWVGDPGYDDE